MVPFSVIWTGLELGVSLDRFAPFKKECLKNRYPFSNLDVELIWS